MTNKILKSIGSFFNKGNTMDNNDDERNDSAETPIESATTSAASASISSTTASTVTTVYNADGSTTYNYGNNSYTVNNNGYVVSGSGGGNGSGTISSISIGSGGASYNGYAYSSTGNFSFNYVQPTYKATIDYTSGNITAQNLILDGADVGQLLSTICDRLAIIESADPEQLEKYKALNEAYKRYKFLEKLLIDKGDKDGL